MQESIFTRVGARFRSRQLWVVRIIAVGLALTAFYLALPVQADASSHENSSGCFGEALSDDPLHCEVLEWAHDEGVIEVDGIYKAGKALFIYLSQDEPLGKAALDRILAKTREVVKRLGKDEYACVLSTTLCSGGILLHPDAWYILPLPSGYNNIKVYTGGAEARRSYAGWRAFEQFWPESEEGASGASGTTGTFDISEVDRINFPDLRGCGGTHCAMWDKYPNLEIASKFTDTVADKVYFSVKVGAGEAEAAKIAAAKTELMAAQPDYYTEDRLVIIPVPHDFKELWRWELVLDRFANSSGNTLGITRVSLDTNVIRYPGRENTVFPVEGVPDPSNIRHESGTLDRSAWRLTIHVLTLDLQPTVDAMPRLLKQLGIPETAVGVIHEVAFEPVGVTFPDTGGQLEMDPVDNQAEENVGFDAVSLWIWAAVATGLFLTMGALFGLHVLRSRSVARSARVD